MKTLKQINANLELFASKYGINLSDMTQGSEAWFSAKLGVISASNASKAVAGTTTASRSTYMNELIAQIATGEMRELSAPALDWGNSHEAAARSSYEFVSGHDFHQLGFAFKDATFRVGCSPDALVNEKKGCEIKCPYNTTNYIDFLLDDKLKPEWKWQVQMSMWVLGLEQWDFAQYDPRMKKNPIKIITVDKDEKKFKTLDDAIPQFIKDMDEKLKKAGFTFGEQWERLALKESA
tara:strand:+ start:14441 stop:15148 length:708 start_codon:yes stop_codon:yes gene_type:complete